MQAYANPSQQRQGAIQKYKEHGGKVAAVLPIHYPRALLRAFDILPVEVWGPPRVKKHSSAAHLQPYICSVAHNALSFLLSRGLEPVDIILVPHTCDTLQGLGSLLLDFIQPRQPVLTLYMPRKNDKDGMDFLAKEIEWLYLQLEKFTSCSPSQAQLMECIYREEAADRVLGELHAQRRYLDLWSLSFYQLVRSREYLPAEEFEAIAKAALLVAQREPQQQGTPILLSGIVPEPMTILQAIDQAGGYVGGDDLACCGRRVYSPGTSEEPFTRMAESLLYAPSDPTRGSPIQQRYDLLLQQARQTGARGILFYEVKFCEPELFDLPSLRKKLLEAGIRSMVVEMDLNDSLSLQNLTRLEAFLETIR